jgi:hypothetical protein
MKGKFVEVGDLTRSNSGKTFKVHLLSETGKRQYAGQITRIALTELLDGAKLQTGIFKYSQMEQQP